MPTKKPIITSFDFAPGKYLAGKYEVLEKLGEGWEGEVYLIREKQTQIEGAAKFFFPHRNVDNKNLIFYAKKLNKLRDCPLVIHYHTQDQIVFQGQKVHFLVSEYVEGELLKDFLKRQPGKRLNAFQALHLLFELAKGVQDMHSTGEYHGDLHLENIIVRRFGLGFELKVLDMYNWGKITHANRMEDIFDMIKVFYDSLGGAKHYAKQPKLVKDICCGLRRSLIAKKYKRVSDIIAAIKKGEWV